MKHEQDQQQDDFALTSPKADCATVTRWVLQEAAAELLPDSGVRGCMQWTCNKAEGAHLMHSQERMRAYYSNVFLCGLLWHCPLCAERISEHRRKELIWAVDKHPELSHVHIILTLQHHLGDRLSVLLKALIDSYRFMKSGRKWQDFVKEHGWVGSVRALETTHGFAHGWHPHLHLLGFTKWPDREGIETFIKSRWSEVLQHHEQTADYAHGALVSDNESDIAKYISKFGHEPVDPRRPFRWGPESELTRGTHKSARDSEHRTMTELLTDYVFGDSEAGRLWREYAVTFAGRNQLVWSRDLRKKLGMDKELTDDEAAKARPADLALLMKLSQLQWKIVKDKRLRGELLSVANAGDISLVSSYLRGIGTE